VAARRTDARSTLPDSGESGARQRNGAREPNGAPDPLSHATPDAELIEAQLAAGRGEEVSSEPFDEIDTPEEERELEELATGGGGAQPPSGRTRGTGGRGGGDGAAPASAAPARKASLLSRLITFLKGSWAELQRVQWPDRRQVMQATGVVIGFVIVAGLYLGVADWAAGKIMDFILK
jgi:preprotein translocase SecE subunit